MTYTRKLTNLAYPIHVSSAARYCWSPSHVVLCHQSLPFGLSKRYCISKAEGKLWRLYQVLLRNASAVLVSLKKIYYVKSDRSWCIRASRIQRWRLPDYKGKPMPPFSPNLEASNSNTDCATEFMVCKDQHLLEDLLAPTLCKYNRIPKTLFHALIFIRTMFVLNGGLLILSSKEMIRLTIWSRRAANTV